MLRPETIAGGRLRSKCRQARLTGYPGKTADLSTPVEMTILFGDAKFRFHDELSTRPERSVVERSAVFFSVSYHGHDRRATCFEIGAC